MPRLVKGTPGDREKFMFEVFQKFYNDPTNAGKDLSVQKANEIFRKRWGSMLRNKRSYQIRASVKAQIGAGTKQVQAARPGQKLVVAPGQKHAACLIEGTPEQIAWFQTIWGQLQGSGLVQGRIDHANANYAVLAKS